LPVFRKYPLCGEAAPGTALPFPLERQHPAGKFEPLWHADAGNAGAPRVPFSPNHQEEHHKTESFKEELLRILMKYQVPYDERYLWD
jgi:hypothetical protein